MNISLRNTGFSIATLLFALPALAQDNAVGDRAHALGSIGGMAALAAGIAMGIAALGGTLGQSRAAGAALEGIARNPAASEKLFLPMILSLVFIESLVLFTFAIAFFLQGYAATAFKGLGVG